MEYRIDIFGLDHTDTPVTVLFSPDIRVERWSKRINAPGIMAFSMSTTDTKATPTNLRPYRRVRLYRKNRDGTPGYSSVWFGYIETTTEIDSRIEVVCAGMLKLFRKRWAASNEQFNGEGSTEAFDLLDATNANDGDTFIVSGTGDVTSTKDVQAQGDVDVLRSWELLAQAHDAEFEIDDDGLFNFVSSIGTDKSGTVILRYNRNGRPGTNVLSIEYGESGQEMATKIICSSNAGSITSTRPSAPSSAQDTYGVLIEKRQLNEAQDQGTLDSMTETLLSQLENPITDFRIVPQHASKRLNTRSGERVFSGLQYGDVGVGDLVNVIVNDESRTISEAKRIAEIVVDVDENGKETVGYTLSKSGVFLTAAYLDSTIVPDILRRVKSLESMI